MPKMSGLDGVYECARLFECWATRYNDLDLVNADGLTRDAVIGLSIGMYVALDAIEQGYDSEEAYLTATLAAGRILADMKNLDD